MGWISYGPLLGRERGRPLMDRIKYGPAFGPKHGSQLMGRPTRVPKILWAYSWAGPLMSVKSRGPLAGPTHYDPQESCGLTWADPLWHTKILWAFTWAGPLW